jgi:aminoglycoside phosphotransferase (APT) family kinase protein
MDLPSWLRAGIELRLESRVIRARTQYAGFSPGLAARCDLEDGRSCFVKAVSLQQNQESWELHQRESRTARLLPRSVPAPRLLWSYEEETWIALAFEDVEGISPPIPWCARDLHQVLETLQFLADVLTPAPIAVEPIAARFGGYFPGWAKLGAANMLDHLDSWSRRHLQKLIALEREWMSATKGESLAHADIRSDNLLLTTSGVRVVDWPWACITTPWFDLLTFLISVRAEGGPVPDSLFLAHAPSATRDAEAVDITLAALAGFYTERSLAPPEPALPHLRAFQRTYAAAARDWLKTRLDWP